MWRRNRSATSRIEKPSFFVVVFVSSWPFSPQVPRYVAMTTPVPKINFSLLFEFSSFLLSVMSFSPLQALMFPVSLLFHF
jgi:hypothetical protein